MALQLLQTPLADEVSCSTQVDSSAKGGSGVASAISACAAASRWQEALGLLQRATAVGHVDGSQRAVASSEAGIPPSQPASAMSGSLLGGCELRKASMWPAALSLLRLGVVEVREMSQGMPCPGGP